MLSYIFGINELVTIDDCLISTLINNMYRTKFVDNIFEVVTHWFGFLLIWWW